nr:phenazine biosynthesis FMN-dependent oxidase PhzG [Streptomyces sp. HNM0575]
MSGDASLVLPEFDAPPADPLVLLGEWLDGAARRGVREPYAAVLATADADGHPSTRVLLVKEFDGRGLIFAGSRGSRKGLELAARPRASMTFYWRETLQQLTLAGPVELLAAEDSDRIFAARPPAARAASATSLQSRPLEDEAALRERAVALLESPDEIRRPQDWTGCRLVPESIEFWHGSPDRLHRRLRYDRTDATEWTARRLQP